MQIVVPLPRFEQAKRKGSNVKKPQPKPTAVVCSACGLDWEKHLARVKKLKRDPNQDDCIELLKAEMKRRVAPFISASTTVPYGTYTLQ